MQKLKFSYEGQWIYIFQMQEFVGRITMKMIIKASIFHVIIEEEVANGGHGVAAESDKVPMLDVP